MPYWCRKDKGGRRMPKKSIIAVDEDDNKYLIYSAEEMRAEMAKNPDFTEYLMDALYERWIPARSLEGILVWLNINRLKRLEFVELNL